MSDQAPKSGPRARQDLTKAYVLVTVEGRHAAGEQFEIDALLAVELALQGLDVPGATVLRVSAAPNDGAQQVLQTVRR
jgi:hypothetical protein